MLPYSIFDAVQQVSTSVGRLIVYLCMHCMQNMISLATFFTTLKLHVVPTRL